jgi:hypothetical protein
MDIRMVVKRGDKYLSETYAWENAYKARTYLSRFAFIDASEYGGQVMLRFADGTEIEASQSQMFHQSNFVLQ